MPLCELGRIDAERQRYIMKGVGTIPKRVFKQGLKKPRRRSELRSVSDETLNQYLKAGFRVNDKKRGIYVYI